jgi:hypothetical protein
MPGGTVEGRIIIVALFCLLMAAACHETHLNGASDAAFEASVQTMNQEHTVSDAQRFGDALAAAQKALGKSELRRRMSGMSYAQAKTFLDTVKSGKAPSNE